MTTSHLRRAVGASLTATLLLLWGVGAGDAGAGPKDKKPDQTPNDHPSGKDRTASPGGSGTQGKSGSDPDGMSNGGADKPGGSGGFDADKDGNNGCGNDDDFEDDNNGNCGGLKKGHEQQRAARASAKVRATVAGVTITKASHERRVAVANRQRSRTDVDTVAPTVVVRHRSGSAEVLGVSLTRGTVAGGVSGAVGSLPLTGSTTAALALGGIVLVAAGSTAVAAGRARR